MSNSRWKKVDWIPSHSPNDFGIVGRCTASRSSLRCTREADVNFVGIRYQPLYRRENILRESDMACRTSALPWGDRNSAVMEFPDLPPSSDGK
ncbi:hypothetical protein EVAR_43476_1 [Eumeta japonica]|uniref:Uncharacterized protein n=1 Tax=Eumeta variegata TaxID=151549 RepID=A0A4C1YKH4_EUMVA|nr:hypothetical protein EVAR_43476_1 [Eumeta japonica]